MLFRTAACGVFLFCLAHPVNAQPQQPKYSFGWPCSGKVDPAYIHSAEATGGKVMLFKPTEVSGVADEMSASRGHGETVTRVASQLDEGVYDFDIPLDSTIESAYFFISLQCLQFVTVLQPSGDALQVDAPELNYHAYDAIRFFTINAPSPGTWKVRIAGRGFFSLIVNAKTDLALASVSLVQNGVPIKGLAPLGRTVRLEAATRGEFSQVGFQFVSMNGAVFQTVGLDSEQEEGMRRTYAAEMALPAREFRLRMTGVDSKGFSFQRVTQHLFVDDH